MVIKFKVTIKDNNNNALKKIQIEECVREVANNMFTFSDAYYFPAADENKTNHLYLILSYPGKKKKTIQNYNDLEDQIYLKINLKDGKMSLYTQEKEYKKIYFPDKEQGATWVSPNKKILFIKFPSLIKWWYGRWEAYGLNNKAIITCTNAVWECPTLSRWFPNEIMENINTSPPKEQEIIYIKF